MRVRPRVHRIGNGRIVDAYLVGFVGARVGGETSSVTVDLRVGDRNSWRVANVETRAETTASTRQAAVVIRGGAVDANRRVRY